MLKKHARALSIIPLALATISTVSHAATPVIGGSANYELQYGGAISNENPKVRAEIPVETMGLASSLEHNRNDALKSNGNLEMSIQDMDGATLLRAHTIPDDLSVWNVAIRVAGVDIDDTTTDFDVLVEANGGSGQLGELQFKASKDAAGRHRFRNGTPGKYREFSSPNPRLGLGEETALQALHDIVGVSEGAITVSNPGDLNSNVWDSSSLTKTGTYYDAELVSLIYSSEMKLVFPETDFPDQWSAVVDMEVEVL